MSNNNKNQVVQKFKEEMKSTSDTGTGHYNLAMTYLGERDFEAAEKELRLAIQEEPELAEGYVQLGGIAMYRGDLDSCLSYNQMAAD
jgi:Tfp pilus assembly protein PilF